ncbi:cytochrome-c peroxidase [Chitinophaga rhizophila]|uniref:Cytochrome-c peroxidase n=1 Tax=Chitinophaga rhizophila TaxID=2866212 RepID=A0ABS7G6C9_9BACT|nr:cytochrome c peroxidase [Chitinophaga rhizophila]MBW8682860.1 cytochrome-c peroxidase [Chitinophaga rhizophila]
MKRTLFIITAFIVLCALTNSTSLRELYSKPVNEWPRPTIDSGVVWEEMAPLPKENAWVEGLKDPQAQLGRLLFFDPRLSRSNQISCSSCHEPDLAWGDGRRVSLGNDHLQGSRNTASLINVFIYDNLFWDGRAGTLNKQVLGPLGAHHEMDMDAALLPAKLQAIAQYDSLFNEVYPGQPITVDNIATAIATFEKTIRSRRSKFDLFMEGRVNALSDQELEGLHLFRTKARCMNCHYGPYFTDKQFHNIGLTYYQRKYEDLGRYNITHNIADIGRFRTPSLRDVAYTGPYMHNGLFPELLGVINIYNSGMQLSPKPGQENDALFPKTDILMQPLQLTANEKSALVAFLHAISAKPLHVARPVLPQ